MEPPVEYHFDFCDGVKETDIEGKERKCTYSKNHSGLVLVTLGTIIEAGLISPRGNMLITTLPEGFRPQGRQDLVLLHRNHHGPSGGFAWGYGIIDTNGKITFSMFAEQENLAKFDLSVDVQSIFYAAHQNSNLKLSI